VTFFCDLVSDRPKVLIDSIIVGVDYTPGSPLGGQLGEELERSCLRDTDELDCEGRKFVFSIDDKLRIFTDLAVTYARLFFLSCVDSLTPSLSALIHSTALTRF
jgi:hypothetical protein